MKIADRLGFSWYDDVTGYITNSKYFYDFAGKFIGEGHVWSKPADEFAGIVDTEDEFVDLIGNIIRNLDEVRHLPSGRKAYWDRGIETVVIFDLGDVMAW